MALNKNGLGHRPFGAWALEEDRLEEEAASLSNAERRPNEQQSSGAPAPVNVKKP